MIKQRFIIRDQESVDIHLEFRHTKEEGVGLFANGVQLANLCRGRIVSTVGDRDLKRALGFEVDNHGCVHAG